MKKIVLLLTVFFAATASFAQLAPLEKAQKAKDAFFGDYLRVYGYGHVVANFSEFPDRGQAKLTSQYSFDIVRAVAFVTGNLGAKKQFGYMLMYDFGPSACLHEIYAEWLPLNAIGVRLGQYKVPFSLENPMSQARIETVNLSRSAAAMSGNAGDLNALKPDGSPDKAKSGRDAGLQLSGKLFPKDDFHCLEYAAGLFNGTGLNVKDNNNWKDFVASAYVQPIKGLRAGGSIYLGKLRYGFNGAAPTDHVRNHFAVGAEYTSKYFYGRSEFLGANDGGLLRKGGYASFVWKFAPDTWEALAKYDYYDDGAKQTHDITAGINYYFAKLSRLQLNYIFTADELLGLNNAVAMQLQVYF